MAWATFRPAASIRVKSGFKKDGTIVAYATIVDAKSNSAFLADAASVLGWQTLATRVAAGATRVRRGDFGEALASAWLT